MHTARSQHELTGRHCLQNKFTRIAPHTVSETSLRLCVRPVAYVRLTYDSCC